MRNRIWMYVRSLNGAGIQLTMFFVEMRANVFYACFEKCIDLQNGVWMKERLKDFYAIIKNYKK